MISDAQRVSTMYYAEIARTPLVNDPEEERRLLRDWQQKGNVTSRDAIVKTHLKFVVKMAHKRTKDPEAVKDYIAAGNLGLLKACDKFDTKRIPYIRFLTYAGWWVYEEMSNQDYSMASLVHVPAHKHKMQRRQAREFRAAVQEHGPDKVAENAVDALDKIADLRERLKKATGSSKKRIEKRLRYLEAIKEPGLPEGVVTTIDATRNMSNALDTEPSSTYDAERMRGLVRAAISRLPPREQTVLNLVFGVKDEARNLVQIASMMGMCSERVRQLKINGMKLLHRELLLGAVASLPLREATVIGASLADNGTLHSAEHVATILTLPVERVRRIQEEGMHKLRSELHSHLGMAIGFDEAMAAAP